MKKILICILCATMLFCSISCSKQTKTEGASPQVAQSDESSLTVTAGSGITDSAPTAQPTPAPTMFSDPNSQLEATEEYGFIYSQTCKLFYSPEDMTEKSPVVAVLPQGAEIKITASFEDSYLVSFDDTLGYVNKHSVARSRGYINADEVNLRNGAGQNYEIILVTEANTELAVLGRSSEWYNVVLLNGSGTEGFIHMDYVSRTEGYIVDDDVTVRALPSKESESVGSLSSGNGVDILLTYDSWSKIETDDFVGYISSDALQAVPIITKLEKQRAYINLSGVHVREGASVGFNIIDTLYKYSPVYVTGETEDWYRVNLNQKTDENEEGEKTVTGFIRKDFVVLGKPTVYVASQDVNLRSGPGTDYDLLTKVRINSVFIIIANDGDWYKGEVNGNVGYIRGDYLDTKPIGDGDDSDEFSEADIMLAAKVVYLEAKGNGMEAYRAVANTLYNRVKSRSFPDSIKGVVYQKNQYSVINHSKFDSLTPSSSAVEATRQVLNEGLRPLPFNVLFFHASFLGTHWGSDKEYYKTIGDNAFFRYVG